MPAEYQAKCPIPAGWGDGIPTSGSISLASNWVTFVDGGLAWNGSPIDETLLRRDSRAVAPFTTQMRIIVSARGVPCDELRRVTDIVQAEAHCTPGFCIVTEDSAPAQAPSKFKRQLQPIEPSSWVMDDDYPPAAIRAREQGTVAFSLSVDGAGHVTTCTVVVSSGSGTLDAATCAILMQRAKFEPALDATGKPISAIYYNRFRWELPEVDPDPMTSWSTVRRFTLGSEGEILSCEEVPYGPASDRWKIGCQWLATVPQANLKALRGTSTGPVTIVMRYDHIVAGMPAPAVPALSGTFKTVATERVRMDIGEDGTPQACFVDGGQGETAIPADICHQMAIYVPGTGKRSVTGINSLLTDGDPDVASALGGLSAPPVAQ